MIKKGRPTNELKSEVVKCRISERTNLRLDECCQFLNKSKSEIIRSGIDKIYEEIVTTILIQRSKKQ